MRGILAKISQDIFTGAPWARVICLLCVTLSLIAINAAMWAGRLTWDIALPATGSILCGWYYLTGTRVSR